MNAILRTPDIHSLSQAPERAGLHILAAVARCALNVLIVEHRDIFDPPIDHRDQSDLPSALCLAARQLHTRIESLLCDLQLYEATLRDQLRAQSLHDLPF